MSTGTQAPLLHQVMPWLQSAWQAVEARQRQNRLPHGLLLHGTEGVGLGQLADALAAAWLCEENQPGEYACGRCPSCQMREAGTSSDIIRIECAPDKREIPVDAIRGLIGKMTLGRQRSAMRIVTIYPAERLNVAASNAFLKTLEEPSEDNTLLLVSHDPARLMPTLRSRLQAIAVVTPDQDQAMQWLAERHPDIAQQRLAMALLAARGAPLAAQQLLEQGGVDAFAGVLHDLLQVAQGRYTPSHIGEAWAEDLPGMLGWAAIWCHELLRHRNGLGRLQGEPEGGVLAGRPPGWLQARYSEAIDMLRLARTPVSAQLLAERYLMGWR